MNSRSPSRKKLLFGVLLCLLFALGFLLAGPINSFLEWLAGEEIQANLGAPIVEEILKSLGFLVLAVIYLREGRPGFLESIELDYMIGYLLGGLFGSLENYFVYGFFTGLRSVTPLLHAFGTGIIGVGYYFVIQDCKSGIKKLILAYLAAILLHSLWNTLASVGCSFCLE